VVADEYSKDTPAVGVPMHRSLPNGLTSTVVVQAVILGLGVISGILAARLLGPQGRGELAVVILWPSLLVFLAATGVNQAIVFLTGKHAFESSEILGTSAAVGLVQSLLVLLAGVVIIPLALRSYSPEVRRFSYLFLVSSPFLILSGYPGSIFQGRMELGRFNLLRTVSPAVYAAGLSVLFVIHQHALENVVSLQVFAYCISFLIGYWLLHGEGLARFRWNQVACRRILAFGSRSQLGNITNYVNRSADQLVLSLLVPPRDLGLYAVAVTVSGAVAFLPQAAGMVTLASGSNSDGDEAARIVARNFRFSLAWLVVACAALFVAAGPLIRVAFGPAFAGSTLACRILLPGMVAVGLNQVLYDGARSFGHPELPSYSEGAAMLITLLGLYLFLPKYGFVGAAIASTSAYLGSLIVMLILGSRKMGMSIRRLMGPSAKTTPQQYGTTTDAAIDKRGFSKPPVRAEDDAHADMVGGTARQNSLLRTKFRIE
jgi:O-antigen/teichoic acid export membrane protein